MGKLDAKIAARNARLDRKNKAKREKARMKWKGKGTLELRSRVGTILDKAKVYEEAVTKPIMVSIEGAGELVKDVAEKVAETIPIKPKPVRKKTAKKAKKTKARKKKTKKKKK